MSKKKICKECGKRIFEFVSIAEIENDEIKEARHFCPHCWIRIEKKDTEEFFTFKGSGLWGSKKDFE